MAVHVFSIPMRTKFRGITVREGALLSQEHEDGTVTWGEFSPFLDYDADESAPWLAAAAEARNGDWPAPVRDRVPVNVTIPAVGPEQAHEMVRLSGCTTAKVKVAERGQSIRADIARVEAVRDALGPEGKLRIDANAAWDVDDAIINIGLLDAAAKGLEYVEQPVAEIVEMAAVRRRVNVPIAADESIRRSLDPYLVREFQAADIAVLKVQPLGGVRACLRIAEDIGMPVVVSSAVESSIGLAAGVALAAALPELPYACGLGTTSLLDGDLVLDPLTPVDGFLPVRLPQVDPLKLSWFAADESRVAFWEERIVAAAHALSSRSNTGMN